MIDLVRVIAEAREAHGRCSFHFLEQIYRCTCGEALRRLSDDDPTVGASHNAHLNEAIANAIKAADEPVEMQRVKMALAISEVGLSDAARVIDKDDPERSGIVWALAEVRAVRAELGWNGGEVARGG